MDGAYQTRLSFVIDNLTVASESTQASESVIRDVNMAKEMTIYPKNNVLSQSAQAMLAQGTPLMLLKRLFRCYILSLNVRLLDKTDTTVWEFCSSQFLNGEHSAIIRAGIT